MITSMFVFRHIQGYESLDITEDVCLSKKRKQNHSILKVGIPADQPCTPQKPYPCVSPRSPAPSTSAHT